MEKRKKQNDKDMLKHISESIREVACSINNLASAVREPRKRDVIKIFVCQPEPANPRVRFEWSVGQPQSKQKENSMPLELKITNEEKIRVTLAPVTSTGKPAKLDGKPTWEVVSGNSTVNVADDGLSAELVSADDPGDTQVLVKADANLGEGVEEVSDIIKLTVAGAQAQSLGLKADAPTPKE